MHYIVDIAIQNSYISMYPLKTYLFFTILATGSYFSSYQIIEVYSGLVSPQTEESTFGLYTRHQGLGPKNLSVSGGAEERAHIVRNPSEDDRLDKFRNYRHILSLKREGQISDPSDGKRNICLLDRRPSDDYATILLPSKAKIEGKIEFNYKLNKQEVKNQLSYTEVIDTDGQRYKLSIGYLGQDQRIYYARRGEPTITATDSSCKVVEHLASLVPELSWFSDFIIPPEDARNRLEQFPMLVGPSGLMAIISDLTSGTKLEFVRQERYRNILSDHYTNTVYLPKMDVTLKIDLYSLESISIETSEDERQHLKKPYSLEFSIARGEIGASIAPVAYNFIFKADVFSIELMGLRDSDFSELDYEFKMPLAVGCSEFLVKTDLKLEETSFSMLIKQGIVQRDELVSYESSSGYLRREIPGKSVNIWDMKEDLLYRIDLRETDQSVKTNATPVNTCVVLDVSQKLISAFKPYLTDGTPIDILDYLGANNLAYMGRGYARDQLHCYIYETILDGMPPVFSPIEEAHHVTVKSDANRDRDYIVQYYFATNQELVFGQPVLNSNTFTLTRIVLFERRKAPVGSIIKLVDQIDVYDFHWSIYGLELKPSEMFMATDCFTNENEQLKVELSFKFNDVHGDNPNSEEGREILDHNKFKLEYDLIDNFLKYYGISRMHVIEYEVEFKHHSIDVNLVIADMGERKQLLHFQSGWIAEECHEMRNCVQLITDSLSEESCISSASMVREINYASYCPGEKDSGSAKNLTCRAYYNNTSPAITNNVPDGEEACQIYEFKSMESPKKGTVALLDFSKTPPSGLKCSVVALKPNTTNQTVILTGKVEHFDISHEVKLAEFKSYKYVVPGDYNHSKTNIIRKFDNMKVNDRGDCIKLCNLDIDCHSYSYCYEQKTCLLATLDIRSEYTKKQMMHATPVIEDGKTRISLEDWHGGYNLELSKGCDIFEKDYLSTFERTGEILSIQRGAASKIPTEPTTFECAKKSINRGYLKGYASRFAYCAQTNTCILYEDLILNPGKLANRNNRENDDDDDKRTMQPDLEDEIMCAIYRRKLQTYFHLSVPVVVASSIDQQVSTSSATVEECAHLCWEEFGSTCHSFDYCHSSAQQGGCRINKIPTLEAKTEPKSGCLHYERDLKFDELRRNHLKGRHQPLDFDVAARNRIGLFPKLLLYFFLTCAFVIGLHVGNTFRSNYNSPGQIAAAAAATASNPLSTIRKSLSAASGLRFSQIYTRFPSFSGEGVPSSSSLGVPRKSRINSGIANDTYFLESSSGIPMEELRKGSTTIPESDAED